MKINEKHQYHGPALAQIVEHPSFKALNRANSGAYGHYLLNQECSLWMKYATGDEPWQYTFTPEDLQTIRGDSAPRRYYVLACGIHSICCLKHDELFALIDTSASTQQWIKVEAPPGTGLKVRGGKDPATIKTIPHSRFPDVLFEQ